MSGPPTPATSRRSRAYLPATREDPRAVLPARRRRPATRPRSRAYTSLDVDAATSSTGSASRSSRTIEEERRAIARGRRVRRRHPAPTAPPSTPTRPRSPPRRRRSSPAARRTSTARSRRAPRWFTRVPKAGCEVRPRRAAPREGRPGGVLLPADASTAAGPGSTSSTPTTFRAGRTGRRPRTTYHESVPGPPLPARPRDGARGPAGLPDARLLAAGHGVRRGLGALHGAGRRRGGPVPERGRAVRHARQPGAAGRPPGRRHGSPRLRLEPPEGVRDDGGGGDPPDRRGHRDRPLHRLAGPGARLHDRPPRDRAAARASGPPGRATAFDIRRFHDDVLRHGKLPLRILADVVLG